MFCRFNFSIIVLFSEELKIMDRNTVRFMIDEMQKGIDNKDAAIADKDAALADKDAALADMNAQLKKKDALIAQLMANQK